MVSGNVTGWVKAKYLVTDEKAEKAATKVGRECVEITTNSLRVRALPTTDAPIYSVVSEGEEFVIRENNLTTEFVEKVIKKQKFPKRRSNVPVEWTLLMQILQTGYVLQ